MNVQETLQILSALKACGAVHFKSQDFEISMGSPQSLEPLSLPPQEPAPAQAPVSSPFPETAANTERAQELIKTLSMNDMDLVDKIFPAGAGG